MPCHRNPRNPRNPLSPRFCHRNLRVTAMKGLLTCVLTATSSILLALAIFMIPDRGNRYTTTESDLQIIRAAQFYQAQALKCMDTLCKSPYFSNSECAKLGDESYLAFCPEFHHLRRPQTRSNSPLVWQQELTSMALNKSSGARELVHRSPLSVIAIIEKKMLQHHQGHSDDCNERQELLADSDPFVSA